MKIILVDNFDSFSYNLVHYFEQLEVEMAVVNNRDIDVSSLAGFDACVLSPGPGLPKEAGLLMKVVEYCVHHKIPLLGVCLGMQAIAENFGDELYNQDAVKHGTATVLKRQNDSDLYRNLPEEFKVGLYHSWAVNLKEHSPLIPTAMSADGILMSIQHKELPVYAVQYHPESILSENGLAVLGNFLKIVKHIES